MSKFMRGSPLLESGATIPGAQLTKEEKKIFIEAMDICRQYGLDFYNTIIQKVRYDEMSEIAAYGGFMHRYPHWYWGMQYEELQRGYEYNQHKIYEMVINCCAPDTRILTTKGSFAIKDIKSGDTVIARDGLRTVLLNEKQQTSKVCNIHLCGMIKPIVCTPHHKWLVLDGTTKKWIETSFLRVGDKVLAGGRFDNFINHSPSINWTSEKIYNETLSNVRNRLKPISPPDKITLNLAELLGVCAGDGSQCVAGAENAITVAIDNKQHDYIEHVKNLMASVFGIEPAIYKPENSCCALQINSKYAVDYFHFCGMKKGVTFESKIVPDIIWQSSNEYRAAYLRGIFDTDGYVGKYLSMSSKSLSLISDVQGLLLEMGIRSEVTHVNNKHNIYVLTIKNHWNRLLFFKYIGFSLKYKQDRLEKLLTGFHGAGRGMTFQSLQLEIVENLKSIENYKKLPTWIKRFVRLTEKGHIIHHNALYEFINRVILADYNGFEDLCEIISTPMFEVKEVEDGGEQETYDIALDHDQHDFLANGLISHNTNPCIIYILSSNTLGDNVCVVVHATGHNDFFKNNIFFTPTDENMMNKLANNGERIRKYMNRWGKEKVTEFIDHVLRIQTLIDPAKAWTEKEIKEPIIKDSRNYYYPRRLRVGKDQFSYMDEWINPKEYIDEEYDKIKDKELANELELFQTPDKDVFGFLKDNAHLKPWKADIMAMLYEESMYFAPQRATKTLNEGWASFIDFEILARQGKVSLGQKSHDMGIFEYAIHKMGVLGGKYSTNPYKTGFYLLLDIEERWNKGRFGREWEECKNMKQKEEWDTKANLGKQKLFEVRKYYNDLTFVNEFFTQEFCDKFEYYEWKHYPNGEWRIESRDAKIIKRKLLQQYVNGGLPDIRVVDPNHRNRNYLLLQHFKDEYDDRELYDKYAREVLTSINYLWGKEVMLSTVNKNKDHMVYVCVGSDANKDVALMTEEEYEKTW